MFQALAEAATPEAKRRAAVSEQTATAHEQAVTSEEEEEALALIALKGRASALYRSPRTHRHGRAAATTSTKPIPRTTKPIPRKPASSSTSRSAQCDRGAHGNTIQALAKARSPGGANRRAARSPPPEAADCDLEPRALHWLGLGTASTEQQGPQQEGAAQRHQGPQQEGAAVRGLQNQLQRVLQTVQDLEFRLTSQGEGLVQAEGRVEALETENRQLVTALTTLGTTLTSVERSVWHLNATSSAMASRMDAMERTQGEQQSAGDADRPDTRLCRQLDLLQERMCSMEQEAAAANESINSQLCTSLQSRLEVLEAAADSTNEQRGRGGSVGQWAAAAEQISSCAVRREQIPLPMSHTAAEPSTLQGSTTANETTLPIMTPESSIEIEELGGAAAAVCMTVRLPLVSSSSQVVVDLVDDLVLELSVPGQYSLNQVLPIRVDEGADATTCTFNKSKHELTIRMQAAPTRKLNLATLNLGNLDSGSNTAHDCNGDEIEVEVFETPRDYNGDEIEPEFFNTPRLSEISPPVILRS